jgi:hypothetical protein
MKFKTERRQVFGAGVSRGKRYHYVTWFGSEQVATGDTKEQAEERASNILLGAYRAMNNPVYASITVDGHAVTTREYMPGQVEFAHHRDADGRQGGSMLSQLVLLDEGSWEKRNVSVAEFHRHYLESYNGAFS